MIALAQVKELVSSDLGGGTAGNAAMPVLGRDWPHTMQAGQRGAATARNQASPAVPHPSAAGRCTVDPLPDSRTRRSLGSVHDRYFESPDGRWPAANRPPRQLGPSCTPPSPSDDVPAPALPPRRGRGAAGPPMATGRVGVTLVMCSYGFHPVCTHEWQTLRKVAACCCWVSVTSHAG